MVEFGLWGDREWDRFNGDRVEVPLVLLDMLINGATLFAEGRRVSRLPGARANWEATLKQARAILNAGISAIETARIEGAQRSAAPAEVWTCPQCGYISFEQVRVDLWRCLSCKREWSTAEVEACGRLARSVSQL